MSLQKKIGDKGEELALRFLKDNKYQILEQNYRYKRAEIDIVALDVDVVVFIEVKTRRNNYFGFPESFVNEKKIEMMQLASEEYLFQNPKYQKLRFDIISIINFPARVEIEHFKDAF